MFSVAIELGAPRKLSHYKPLAVAPGLRGYTVDGSQLRVAGGGKVVSITGLAARYCPTGRDLYLEKRLRVDTPSWERSVLGKVVDETLVQLHTRGLDLIEDAFEGAVHSGKAVSLPALQKALGELGEGLARAILLQEWKYEGSDRDLNGVSIEDFAIRLQGTDSDLVEKTLAALVDLVRFEVKILIDYLRSRKRARDWMAEVRATLVRLQTGLRLDKNEAQTKIFGVSQNICPDFLYSVALIGDVKTGGYHSFYESVATGYAIFAESILGRRINTAAILAVELDLQAGKVRSHGVRLVQPDNEQRQLWLTRRDLALGVINAAAAPSHPDDISSCAVCPYRSHCWEGSVPGGVQTTPAPIRAGAPV